MRTDLALAESDFAPGAMVTPHVRLVRPLETGGMGAVWIAEHLSLQTEVAVKFVATERLAGDPEIVSRFMREASVLAKLRNPHVVQVLDHGLTTEGAPYIVMELLRGETLRRRLERRGRLEPDEVVHIVGQIARALGAAHRAGVIHRDVKPDNVFMCDDASGSAPASEELVKVLDFGLAKNDVPGPVSLKTSLGTMVGTPRYMSPEQALGGEVDETTDLWALGVLAFEALTGEAPFTGQTFGALCVAIDRGVFASPSSLRADLPAGVDAWMRRALDRDRAARFGSAREMAEELAAVVRPPPGEIRPAPERAVASSPPLGALSRDTATPAPAVGKRAVAVLGVGALIALVVTLPRLGGKLDGRIAPADSAIAHAEGPPSAAVETPPPEPAPGPGSTETPAAQDQNGEGPAGRATAPADVAPRRAPKTTEPRRATAPPTNAVETPSPAPSATPYLFRTRR